jgi:F-type H+-transporting ATPase subunit alpha
MVASLNQPQYTPWPTEEQAVAIYAGLNGYLDTIPPLQVGRFQDELREHLRTEGTIYKEIRETKDLSDDVVKRLEAELDKFVKGFNVQSSGREVPTL